MPHTYMCLIEASHLKVDEKRLNQDIYPFPLQFASPNIDIALDNDLQWLVNYKYPKYMEWVDGWFICTIASPFYSPDLHHRIFAFAADTNERAAAGVRRLAIQSAQEQYEIDIANIPVSIVESVRHMAKHWLRMQALP